MAYTAIYAKKAQKDILKLDNLVKRQIKKAIESKLLRDPIEHSVKLKDFPVLGVRRMRVGNYRILFTLSGKRIEVLRIGHRKEIYR